MLNLSVCLIRVRQSIHPLQTLDQYSGMGRHHPQLVSVKGA